LIKRLAQAHEVHVFVPRQENAAARWQLAGASIHNIGRGWTRLRTIAAIRREHRSAPFDVIQAIFSGFCSEVAVAAAVLLGRPSFVHIAGGELAALHDIGYGGRLSWKGRLREALVLRAAHSITAASQPIIDSINAMGLQAQRVPLGVDLAVWPPCHPRWRSERKARLIHVASLNAVKDQSTLLRAMKILDDRKIEFQLDIVGVDTLQGETSLLARKLGVGQHVRFVGFKRQRELRPIMEQADLLVMSSLHEAGPLVLLEAAVAGVPTVGTAVGHIAEWSPFAALSVAVGDPVALADAVCRVLADENLRMQLALAAQGRAIAIDADYTAQAFENLYRSICPVGAVARRSFF
jgi:glycosyltransferase involved in cell wall biosynthesis